MQALKIVAAALLIAVATLTPGTGDREHIMSGDAGTLREHIL